MHRRRGIERDPDRRELPEVGMIIDAEGQGIERDISERVVEEVADQIAEQNHSAHHADLPDADAAQALAESGLKIVGHVIIRIAGRDGLPTSRPGGSSAFNPWCRWYQTYSTPAHG